LVNGENISLLPSRHRYLAEAQAQLDHFLRDHRTGDKMHMILMSLTFSPISLPLSDIRMRRSTSFVGIAPPGAMNSFAPALLVLRKTASI
jgi:hypothetical protein